MTEIASASASRRTALGHSVIAVLGPTNTGKTHLAIERMLGHESGLIGLPLRLLAREVYDKVVARAGEANVALITGEEKIKPERPRYWICTVEAMPREIEVDFLAIDEIQLCADPERGHVFTERLFSARGQSETLLLGAATMEGAIRDLLPGANFVTRHRLSKLTYAGQKKITRLPRRSAIVAFSANEVYAVAELIRRQRGGAAVVLGGLSPRTRNAQVALYQSGDVDFLVATDAIGMGLNLDLDHVAFAGTRKFDGRNHRELAPGELGQIAGRAGRHLNDGSFGVTGDVEPFSSEIISRLENHEFEPVKILQWRNHALEFGSIDRLKDSLRETPTSARLARARNADDVQALDALSADTAIADMARSPAAIKLLWEVCQIPDYRKISAANHADLAASLYKYLMSDEGVIPEDWFAGQVALADRTDGDIDTLSNRIAHIRTWTFVSNRAGWLADSEGWRERTRAIEDTLSDALHDLLTQRFVDRRTSVLMKSMRDKDALYADIEQSGQIFVEKHYVGKLEGFRFTPDTAAAGIHGKAARHAAAKVLAQELSERADRLCEAKDAAFTLARNGAVMWEKQEIGRLEAGAEPLKPVFGLIADEHLTPQDKERVVKRVETWLAALIELRLKPLLDLSRAPDLTGLARGIGFQLVENFGILPRETIAEDIRSLDQQARAELRKFGVRFGAYNIYFPLLLKPAAADMLLLLWALKNGASAGIDVSNLPEPPRQGLTSVAVDKALPDVFYRAAGFHVCGPRAIRVDMLERLADLIRPLTSWKPSLARPEPPAGAVGRGGFKVQPEMLSIIGCSAEEMGNVLFVLGFRKERRQVQPKPVEVAAAPEVKIEGVEAVAEASAEAAVEPANGVHTEAAESAEAIAAEPAPIEPEAEASEPSVAEAVEPMATAPIASDADEVAPAEPVAAESVEAVAAEPAAAESSDAAATPAEPEFEEIWRPRRRVQNDERRQSHRKPEGNRERRPQQQAANAPAADRPAVAAAKPEGRPDRPPRRDRDRERDKPRDDRRRGEWRGGPKGGGGGRPDHAVKSAAPAKRQKEAVADPDSPFAALLQLKERMARASQDQA
ncbi:MULTISPECIES: helicase-related protein [Rhodomicrobium]|uniref:helicase-related protein n=1 Tax=Rhodomicrobium TaxID=1068 RepID=UPI000B4B9F8F|nr:MULTISPECIES: helicase-related protein [Rhodomicrobium]